MAVMLGPQGVGLLSMLRQIRQTALSFGTINGQTALVQGIASHKDDKDKVAYISSVFWIVLLAGTTVSVLLVIFASQISDAVLSSNDPKTITLVRWLALPIFLNVAASFLSGVLNGYRYIGRLAMAGVAGAFVMAMLSYPTANFVYNGHLIAFIYMMTGSAIAAISTSIYFLQKELNIISILSKSMTHIKLWAVKYFFSFSGTLLITGLASTGTLLIIRSMVIHSKGLTGAGIFDVAWTLSMMYVGLVTQSFGTYYMPTLSQITDNGERIVLMRKLFRLATLLMVPIIIAVIALKPLVIHLLYSVEFLPSLDIIRWMLIGDYLKVTSWVLAFPLLSYADMKTFLWTELLWNGFLLSGGYVALILWGHLEGIGILFVLSYSTYLIFTYFYCKIRFKFSLTKKMTLHWVGGLIFILIASYCNWNLSNVHYLSALLWIMGGILISLIGTEKKERKKVVEIIGKIRWNT